MRDKLHFLIAVLCIGVMCVGAGYAMAIADMENSPIVKAQILRSFGVR